MELADVVQCPLMSWGANEDMLSMAVLRAMMISWRGQARIACSSTSLDIPPLRMTVILVVGGVPVVEAPLFVLLGLPGVGAALAAAAA